MDEAAAYSSMEVGKTEFGDLPDEVLELILSMVSQYGDLESARSVSQRLRHVCGRVARRKQSDFQRAVEDHTLRWVAREDAVNPEDLPGRVHRPASEQASGGSCKTGGGASRSYKRHAAECLWNCCGPPAPPTSLTSLTSLEALSSVCPPTSPPSIPANFATVGRRYSHSAVYVEGLHSMYVFGGCTSTATTFNDLWRLDLTTHKWQRPPATGNYPSPKACAAMVAVNSADELEQEGPEGVPEKDDRRLGGQKLYLFGGWTHPSMFPLHRWRLFNELHSYDTETCRWTLEAPNDPLRPPTMAGHSATVHCGCIVVFGGLQKVRNSIGQFSSSSDVWTFDLKRRTWTQEDIPEPKPKPRYGQSQIYLDRTHLMILGGCGGPSNIFDDVWVLTMEPPHWRWAPCRVDNPQLGATHMWCHPAAKVGERVVVLGKAKGPPLPQTPEVSSERTRKGVGNLGAIGSRNHLSRRVKETDAGRGDCGPINESEDRLDRGALPQGSSDMSDHQEARWNVIPQLQRGVNRGYGAIRRHNNPQLSQSASQQQRELRPDSGHQAQPPSNGSGPQMVDNEEDEEDEAAHVHQEAAVEEEVVELSVEPVVAGPGESRACDQRTFRTSVTLKVSDSENEAPSPPKAVSGDADDLDRRSGPGDSSRPGPGAQPRCQPAAALPTAAAAAVPRMQAFATQPSAMSPSGPIFNSAAAAVAANRARQLEALRKVEKELLNRRPGQAIRDAPVAPGCPEVPRGGPPRSCPYHRLTYHVLDISAAVSDNTVSWRPTRANTSYEAPEETILYSLVVGRGELVMFGGIQKDAAISGGSSNNRGSSSSNDSDADAISNSAYFLTPPNSLLNS